MVGHAPELRHLSRGVAEIRLRRPAAHNCLSADDLTVLHDLVASCEGDPDLRVLILSAEGPTFCSGAKLQDVGASAIIDDSAEEPLPFEACMDKIAGSRLVTLAVLNGPAIGGGSDLALAADLAIGTERAGLRMPAAQFGIPLYAGALRRYQQKLGLPLAMSMILTGETLLAADMVRHHLLTRIVAADQLEAQALELAMRIADYPPEPLLAMRRALQAFATGDVSLPEQRAMLAQTFDGQAISARINAQRARRDNPTKAIAQQGSKA